MRSLTAAALLAALLPPGAAEAVDRAALMAERPAKLLSAYGLFADPAAQAPAEGVMPYDLVTPLFSDHAEKLRFVFAPGPAGWSDDEAFDFPAGTALIKTFGYPDAAGGLRLVETRLLIRHEAGWVAWPYLWDKDQKDARLKLAGARLPMEVAGPDGAPLAFEYRVPNANECAGCHSLNGAIAPIGPKARNLNHEFAYPQGAENQIARWRRAGLLEGGGEAPAPADWIAGSLDARARAYLDVNCAHCHRAEGPASNSGLFLTYGESDPVARGIGKRPVAAGRGSAGLAHDVEPGRPEESILLHRMRSAEPGVMMPELGRALIHEEGVALIEAWIAAME